MTSSKQLLLILLLLLLVGTQEAVCQYSHIHRVAWLQLDELQDYICLLSRGSNSSRVAGWFCVKDNQCSVGEPSSPLPIIPDSKPYYECRDFQHNEGRDTCCYIGGLKPPLDVASNEYDTYLYVKNESEEGDLTSFSGSKEILHSETSSEAREKALKDHHICGITPTGIKDKFTVYEPYVCVEEDSWVEHSPLNVSLRYGEVGDHLCSRENSGQRPVCCHLSAAVDPSTKENTWAYKEFSNDQQYVPGFRSSFMCEQYNRLVCEGPHDRCPLRVLKRETAYPAEFPHQALVGVSSHNIQFFHCAGSLVSKYFVLTAYDCQTYDGLSASMVLVGDYNIEQYHEGSSNEQVTYVKKHFTNIENNFFLLLRLWRPLKLNHLVRPACIDWFSKKENYVAKDYDFGIGWLTGYGPVSMEDKFNNTIKRYKFTPKDRTPIDKCTWRVPTNKRNNFVLGESESHLCLKHGARFSLNPAPEKDFKSGQGYYDMGAPFNVLKDYCIWNIYGMSIQDDMYISKPPTLIETIPNALEWIEEVVWRNDFNLLSFDMSWPDCSGTKNLTFRNMNFLSTDHNEWYKYN